MSRRQARGTIASLAARSADSFASEPFIGGVAIAGLVLMLIAAGTLSAGSPQATFTDPLFLLVVGLFAAALYLILLAGILFVLRRLIQRDVTLRIIDAFTGVSLELAKKVKEGTVNSAEIVTIAQEYLRYLKAVLETEF
jgi:hypothetical protein